MKKLFERALHVLFFVTLVTLLLSVWVSTRGTSVVISGGQVMLRSQETLSEVDRIITLMTEGESALRAHVIAGSPESLAEYKAVKPAVDASMARLRELTKGTPSQQRMLPLLEEQISRRLGLLEDGLAAYKTGGINAARTAGVPGRARAVMNDLRNVAAVIREQERIRLQQRSTINERTLGFLENAFLISGLSAAFVMIVFYFQARRTGRERSQLLAQEQAARASAEAAYEAEQAARREAEDTSRVKDQFLATVSHELRTPLNAMLGWAHMLRSGTLDDAMFARGLETIERNARSQAQLIEDLLDVSGIISGKLRLNVAPVDAGAVAATALDVLRPAAEAKGVRLHSVIDSAAGAVSGDAERLQQVIWNLLSNAIKFTPKDGRVELRLERVHSHVELTVTDTGAGISPEFLPHVFELFRQADSSPTRKHSGLGLGLAIARSITELHGGTIRAESAGLGRGATFTLSLPIRGVTSADAVAPVARKAATLSQAAPADFIYPSLEGLRMLCVDDQPDTCEMVSVVLGKCGAEVRSAETAAEAFHLLKEWRPDLMVADIGMPGEDGYSLIKRVRALPPDQGGRTPAIALTAYARVEDRVRVLAAGYQMHVAKPVESAELVTIIASLLGRSISPPL